MLRSGTFRGVLAALCGLLLAGVAHADLVHLKNGRVMQGEVVSEDDQVVVLKVPYGEVKLRKDQIDFIERQSPQEYRLDLGRNFLARKRFEEAVAQFEEALRGDPNSRGTQAALVNAYRQHAQELHRQRRFEEARKQYGNLLKLAPEDLAAAEALKELEASLQKLEGMLEEGRRALAREAWDEAILHLQQALAYAPDSAAKLGPLLGAAYAKQGKELYLSQRFSEAAASLERAFAFDAGLANTWENLYAASSLTVVLGQLSDGRIDEAKTGLTRLLNFAPTNAYGLYIAGRLEQTTRNFKQAGEFFARGLREPFNNPTSENVARLRAQLEAKLGIPDGGAAIRFDIDAHDLADYAKTTGDAFQTFETAHFKVYHYNETLAQAAGETLEYHLERQQTLSGLKANFEQPPKVFLHRTKEEYLQATGQQPWSGGIARFAHRGDGVMVRAQIHSWQTSPTLLKSVLPHELMHLLVNSNLKRYEQLPVAVHEGLAVMMEPAFRQQYYLSFLQRRMESKAFIPLDALLTLKDYPGDPDFFYAEGLALMKYLANKKGLEAVMGLVRGAGQDGGAEAGLLELSGAASIDDLEAQWRHWLQGSK
ncbi:MAG: hypothetical protein M5U26_14955 [Planctomycetota bacterium]|nr:hypothetical protein [Planctomycetota bacterium]